MKVLMSVMGRGDDYTRGGSGANAETSAVPARLGLDAPALAQLKVALASLNDEPGLSHNKVLGSGLAWPEPQLAVSSIQEQ
jgi:hypothetical protein